ncbi:MAG: ATPase, T2SS/T4P/T4SS family, partial [Candidatus Margulisiibacteriota bacterium]
MEITAVLKKVIEKSASDLLIVADSPPVIRRGGMLAALEEKSLTADECKKLIYALLTDQQQARFEKEKELDSSYHVPGMSRFRVNVHYQRGSVAAALRAIPEVIPPLDTLHLPASVLEFIKEPRGLVLVTGATGSGKS